MITDSKTNTVYLSSLLKTRYEGFFNELMLILVKHNIPYKLIEGTRDIWCRDYMPVQISHSEFIQFTFFPDYYLSPKHVKLLTIQEEISYKVIGNIRYVDLIVDSGNIVKSKNKAIITDKVIDANNNRDKTTVLKMLKKELGVSDLILIPVQPYDITGHSDGMVRFYDDSTILINDFSGSESSSWLEKLNRAIRLAGLEQIPFPYQPSEIKKDGEHTAHGCYINFAQIGNIIIFPQFGGDYKSKDNEALKRITKLYPGPEYIVEPINADPIAYNGGVLNCCTWNINQPIIDNAIDFILPIYGDENHMLVINFEDYQQINTKDILCVSVSPSRSSFERPWSLMKMLKFGCGEEPISANSVEHYRKKLVEQLSPLQLSEILGELQEPSTESKESLVNM